jgi:ribosome-binding factor A
VKLRYIPALTFVKDTSLDRVKRVMTLLDQVQPQPAEPKDNHSEA